MRARPFSEHGSHLRHHGGTFAFRVVRRHVDLLRVSSALCTDTAPRH
ncbi:putative leader peptide [Streptomyces sp. NPDC001770]